MVKPRRSASIARALVLCGVLLPGIANGDATQSCKVVFGVSETPTLNTLQFTVDYSAIQGTFSSDGSNLQCFDRLEGTASHVTSSCTDGYEACQWGRNRELRVSLIGIRGFSGPAEILTCTFEAVDTPGTDDFEITVENAGEVESKHDSRRHMAVNVARIDCGKSADTEVTK